jgi:AcrR family transcriptional regulator
MERINRQQAKRQVRARIRDAAAISFATKGVSGASIEDITDRAGYSRGAFYSCYKSKQELLLELLEKHQLDEITSWKVMLAEAESVEEALPNLQDRFDEYMLDEQRRLLVVELQLEASRNPAFGEAHAAMSKRVLVEAEALVASLAAKAGRKDIDIPLLANITCAIYVGLSARSDEAARPPGDVLIGFLKVALSAGG